MNYPKKRETGTQTQEQGCVEAERQARQAIAEAEKLKAEIEAETSIATQQKRKP